MDGWNLFPFWKFEMRIKNAQTCSKDFSPDFLPILVMSAKTALFTSCKKEEKRKNEQILKESIHLHLAFLSITY